jgi:dihydrofolate reductase
MLAMIAALAQNRVIGLNNQLPWRLPADLRHFRRTTLGKTVVMGRKTWESLARPLPERRNIVLSQQPDYTAPGAEVWHDPVTVLNLATHENEVFIIGGESLYRLFLEHATRLYLTEVQAEFRGDTWFPALPPGQWRQCAREDHAADADNPWSYCFSVWEKI